MTQQNYKQCKECLAYHPDHPEYVHECDGLMKFLVKKAKARNKTVWEKQTK